jgi:hypothetical protein
MTTFITYIISALSFSSRLASGSTPFKDEATDCPICMEGFDIDHERLVMDCGHALCCSCFVEMQRLNVRHRRLFHCALCRMTSGGVHESRELFDKVRDMAEAFTETHEAAARDFTDMQIELENSFTLLTLPYPDNHPVILRINQLRIRMLESVKSNIDMAIMIHRSLYEIIIATLFSRWIGFDNWASESKCIYSLSDGYRDILHGALQYSPTEFRVDFEIDQTGYILEIPFEAFDSIDATVALGNLYKSLAEALSQQCKSSMESFDVMQDHLRDSTFIRSADAIAVINQSTVDIAAVSAIAASRIHTSQYLSIFYKWVPCNTLSDASDTPAVRRVKKLQEVYTDRHERLYDVAARNLKQARDSAAADFLHMLIIDEHRTRAGLDEESPKISILED